MTDRPVIITRAVQTCRSHPSQWNAWTIEGQYLYLRYRGGLGTVHAFDDPDSTTWPDWMGAHDWADHAIARFHVDDVDPDTGRPVGRWDADPNEISLGEFCQLAGVALALGLDRIPAIKAAWVEHFGGAA